MYWGVISALISVSIAASFSPSWKTTPYIQCYSIALITANTSTASQNYSFSSFTPLANGERPTAFLGILNWELAKGLNDQITFNVTHTSMSTTLFRIRTQLGDQTSISSLMITLFLMDALNFSVVSADRISSTGAFVNISTGTGNRYDTGIVSFSQGAINLNHSNFMIPCLTSLNMKSNGSQYFALKVTLQILNQTHYYWNFSTGGNNIINSALYYRIIYDQTQIQKSKYNYLDVKFFLADNNVITQNVSFVFSKTNNFMAGINAFNYSNTQLLQFNFSTQTFAFTNKYTYNHINITCWNYRYRQCPAGYTYYLEEQNLCYDVCPPKYFTNYVDSFCEACHKTCLTCTDAQLTSCSTCDTTRDINSSNACVCKTKTYDNQNFVCTSCAAPCITCSSSTACLTCNTTGNMVLSGTQCVCKSGGMLVLPSKTYCNMCNLISPGCIACSSTDCNDCNTSLNFVRNGSVCQCISNYFLNSSNLCQACPSLPNCIVCKNATYCSQCSASFQPVNGICQCKSQYKFLNSSSQCQDCKQPCQKCINSSFCTTCSNKSLTLLNGVCCSSIAYGQDTTKPCTLDICPKGFLNISGVCKEICGDGILFVLQCDDGNLQNGDGCNSQCTVQTNYTCINGTSTTPSLCSYNQPLQLNLLSSTKNVSANSLVFQISVWPTLKVLNTFDFSSIISLNIPNINSGYTYQNGILKVKVDYNQSLQQRNLTLILSPPTIYNNTFDMKLSNSRFVVLPQNLPAYYFQPTVYQESKALNILLLIATGLGFLICLTFTRKMIGWQLMSVIQMSFFSLCLTNKFHPIFNLWGQYGYISNGFNNLPSNINQLFTLFKLPNNIDSIGYDAQYLQNLNWMFVIELCIFILGVCFFLIGKYLNRLLFNLGVFILKDVLMTFVFFNTFNVSFSFGLQIYSMTLINFGSGETACNFIGIGLCLVFNSLVLYTYFKYTQIYRDELLILKLNRASTIHPFVFCIYRFGIGFLIGIINNKAYTIFIVLALEIIYLIYISINHPHKFTYQFSRGILNQSSIIFHLVTLILYQYILTDIYTSVNHSATGLAWIDIIVILSATIFSCYCLVYSLYKQRNLQSKIQNISNDTVQNLRTKDMIHQQQVKQGLQSDAASQNQHNKVIILSSTESKRKIMDPDEESSRKQSVTQFQDV